MSRRGENIFKRKDGRWEGRYICGRLENGHAKYRSVYAHSYAECSDKLRLARCDMLPVDDPMTVSELFDAWIFSRKNNIKQTTYASYCYMFDHYIRCKLGECRIDRLNAFMLDRVISELIECGGKNGHQLSSKTVKDITVMLKSLFKYGEAEYSLSDPMKNIKPPKCESAEIQVFKEHEIIKIRQYAIHSDMSDLGILLCIYTGLRIGEICALQWGDIDLIDNVIHVRKTLTRIPNPDSSKPKTIVIIDTPKSKRSVRDIPIPTFMLKMLAEKKKHQQNDDYFLTGTQKYTEPRSYSSRYKSFLKRIGVPYKNFHVLRHTFATECIRLGIDVKTVSELLGHSSVKITLERYVHSDMDMKRQQLEKLYSGI